MSPAILAPLLLTLPLAPTPAGEDVLALVPDDAVFLAQIADVDGLEAAARKNDWYLFLHDEEVWPFVEHLSKVFTDSIDEGGAQAISEFEEELGFGLLEAFDALSGSIAVHVSIPDGGGGDDDFLAGVTLLLGEDRAAFEEILDAILGRLDEEWDSTYSTYADVNVSEYAKGEGSPIFVAEQGNYVSFMTGKDRDAVLEAIQTQIARFKGEESTVGKADSELLARARKATGMAGQIEAFVDVERILDLMEAAGELEGGDMPASVRAELMQFSWAHLVLRIGEGELLDLRLGVSWPSGELFGGFAATMGVVPQDLLRLVPRESVNATAGALDLPKTWKWFLSTVQRLDPDGHAEITAGLETMGMGMGVDFEKDLIEQITGSFASFSVEVPREEISGAMAMMSPGAAVPGAPSLAPAYLLGVRDTGRVLGAIDKLLVASELEPMHRIEEFQGYQVHRLDVQGMFKVYWSATEGALVLGMAPTPVLTALRLAGKEGAPTLLAREDFARAFQEHRGATMVSVNDTAQSLRNVLITLQSVSTMVPMMAMASGEEVPQDMPFGPDTPWPTTAAVDRHFSGIGLTALTWKDGALVLRAATR